MHDLDVIIAGGGRVGQRTADILATQGHDVVVIEQDPERCRALAEEYIATVIEGDATQPSILEQTDPGERDVVAALTDDAGANLAICMEAQQLNPEIRTLVRTDAEGQGEYTDIVDAVILPPQASATTAADAITGMEVATIADSEDGLDILEVQVATDAPVAGHTLSSVSLPAGSLVISDADRSALADGATTLEPGHRYVVGVESGVAEEVLRLFRG